METEAALAVVELALRYGFADRMDQATAELERLGWIPELIDGDGSCLDRRWQYPPSDNMWRVYSGLTVDKFYIGVMVNTKVEATAFELADLTRSAIEPWLEPVGARHIHDDESEEWIDEVRMIGLRVHRFSPAGPGKAIPPAMQLDVSSVEG